VNTSSAQNVFFFLLERILVFSRVSFHRFVVLQVFIVLSDLSTVLDLTSGQSLKQGYHVSDYRQGRPIRLRIMRFREAASKSHNVFWAQDMSVISLSVNAIFT